MKKGMKKGVIELGIVLAAASAWLIQALCIAAENEPSAALAEGAASSRDFKLALPGYKFEFPRDHGKHDEFKTEWWYYTGHLQSKEGRKFGFELTFFRSGVPLARRIKEGPWKMNDLYMAHFAISDLSKKSFYHEQKFCRESSAFAKNSADKFEVKVENWSSVIRNKKHHLLASSGPHSIDLQLEQGKDPVIHGIGGVSQKSNKKGAASHYYSLTRMPARAALSIDGQKLALEGEAWMDHEFGSNQLGKEQAGWDWFSIQLNDGSEIMLYLMRLKGSGYDQCSSGTFVDSSGKWQHLPFLSYKIKSKSYWQSPHTKANYPNHWHIELPEKGLVLDIEPELADQELVSSGSAGGARINYWEGACRVSGLKQNKIISGRAYVELTGYDKEFDKEF